MSKVCTRKLHKIPSEVRKAFWANEKSVSVLTLLIRENSALNPLQVPFPMLVARNMKDRLVLS